MKKKNEKPLNLDYSLITFGNSAPRKLLSGFLTNLPALNNNKTGFLSILIKLWWISKRILRKSHY